MFLLSELRERFREPLSRRVSDPEEFEPLLSMIRPAQDPRFGDYQANFAMPLGKKTGQSPRKLAAEIVAEVDVSDLCEPLEVAGPGFINLRIKTDWLATQLRRAERSDRLGIPEAPAAPRTFVIDYSSPNVAKPMHVGHIRSTVIGHALDQVLRFLGHQVISDNHLGDWGTQFGMIIYGYKHFLNATAYEARPVEELGRLYKLVNQLVEFHAAQARLPEAEQRVVARQQQVADKQVELEASSEKPSKKVRKELSRLQQQVAEVKEEVASLQRKIAAVTQDPDLLALAAAHPGIGHAVQAETARLHEGDEENLRLWNRFLPLCRDEMQRVYRRLKIEFDYEYGESFYHDQLGTVVNDLSDQGIATESDGAICVFLEGFDSPMIVQKRDGAFLYATTDLATIQFRMQQWNPDAILYVVDHRQGEHFAKLFQCARKWGYADVELQHISFGTVLGVDKRPFQTRQGTAVGLEGLLDEATTKAFEVVSTNDDQKPQPELSQEERRTIAEIVGIGAVKYADLSHNRTSDYVFSYDKMMALEGNTATYMQYTYARTRSIFRRGEMDVEQLRARSVPILLDEAAERQLAMHLLRFGDALQDVVSDYRPNLLTAYLFDLAKAFSTFFEHCHVLRAESDELRESRFALCDLTGRTVAWGMKLLGIDVPEKM